MRDFKKLVIWQVSLTLTNRVYEITKSMPKEERYGLNSQIRRSAVSIPSNIAEGCSRNSKKELVRFLEIALGSAFELETQLMIAKTNEMIEKSEADEVINELINIQKKINAYRSRVKYE